ncbi:hypothetical protein SAMN05216389_105162 [Oceanobacillus limi]|uniref:YkoP-like domain-containing protein n=1 Tax=Oceanobacillus limi TaxID=930131 RepID=A0A1I0BSW8_9BACI|nr:hypothetical protein [Oceanobacillus limi]SET09997.1 hypothetical protein SAMN05216389_105162 [Oceanobacillus limi]
MKSYLLGVWNTIDPIYYTLTRLNYLPNSDEKPCVFRVRLTRYKGSTVTLEDGTTIHKNDLLLKIHLHNVRILNEIQSVNSEVRRAVFIYHMVKRSLPTLAQYVHLHPKNEDIKGVIGITTLHKGVEHLGFEVFGIKNQYYRLYKKLTFTPINLLASTSQHGEPAYLFMSKNDLIKKYATNN